MDKICGVADAVLRFPGVQSDVITSQSLTECHDKCTIVQDEVIDLQITTAGLETTVGLHTQASEISIKCVETTVCTLGTTVEQNRRALRARIDNLMDTVDFLDVTVGGTTDAFNALTAKFHSFVEDVEGRISELQQIVGELSQAVDHICSRQKDLFQVVTNFATTLDDWLGEVQSSTDTKVAELSKTFSKRQTTLTIC